MIYKTWKNPYDTDWKNFKVNLKENTIGNYSIKKIKEEETEINPKGTYTNLLKNDISIMEDFMYTVFLNNPCFKNSYGDVLLIGLGIGLNLTGLLQKDNIKNITVIEKEKDIIDLVSPNFKSEKIKYINEDVFDYTPNKKFNYIWHDIYSFDWYENYNLRYAKIIQIENKFKNFCDKQETFFKDFFKKGIMLHNTNQLINPGLE